jgi:hypothetical protein
MKNFILKRFALAIIGLGIVVSLGFTPTSGTSTDHGFAVIELFTSEGCSSCLPADELIAKIEKEYHTGPVYVLAYHVSYWNNAAWRDKFSSAVFTQRQLHYARQLKIGEGPYTPQAIINGTKEMIGADEKQVRQALGDALTEVTDSELTINNPVIKNGDIAVNYQTRGGDTHTLLQLVLVQKNAVRKVLQGENKGRTLSHIQIVSEFKTISLKGKETGVAHISLKPGAFPADFELIGFLQDAVKGNIIAADRTPLIIK